MQINYRTDIYPYLPHPLSPEQHAFQFLPFDALEGYDDAIEESDREVTEDLGLTEEESAKLDAMLAYLAAHIREQPPLEISFFTADQYKNGGHLITVRDRLYQIETAQHELVLKSTKQKIPLNLIRRLKLLEESQGSS